MNINNEIGLRIKELRIKNKMTQKSLALQIGISEQGVSKWERGESLPDISKLIHLSKLLGVTTDELLSGEKQKAEISKKETKYFESIYDEIAYNGDIEKMLELKKKKNDIFLNYDMSKHPLIFYAAKYKQYDMIMYLLENYSDSNRKNLFRALENNHYKELKEVKKKVRLVLLSNQDFDNLKKYELLTLNELSISEISRFFLKKAKFEMFKEVYNVFSISSIKEISEYTIRKNLNEFTYYIIDDLRKKKASNIRNKTYNNHVIEEPTKTTTRLYHSSNGSPQWTYQTNKRYSKYYTDVSNYSDSYEFVYEYAIKYENAEIMSYLAINGNSNVLLKYAIIENNIQLIETFDNNDPWTEKVETKIHKNTTHYGASIENKTPMIVSLKNNKFSYILESDEAKMFIFLMKKNNRGMNIQEALVLKKIDVFRKLIIQNELLQLVKLLNTQSYKEIKLKMISFLESERFKECRVFSTNSRISAEKTKVKYLSELEDNMNDDSIHADELIGKLLHFLRREVREELSSNMISKVQVVKFFGHSELGDLGLEYFVKIKDLKMIEFILYYSLNEEVEQAIEITDSKRVREILLNYKRV